MGTGTVPRKKERTKNVKKYKLKCVLCFKKQTLREGKRADRYREVPAFLCITINILKYLVVFQKKAITFQIKLFYSFSRWFFHNFGRCVLHLVAEKLARTEKSAVNETRKIMAKAHVFFYLFVNVKTFYVYIVLYAPRYCRSLFKWNNIYTLTPFFYCIKSAACTNLFAVFPFFPFLNTYFYPPATVAPV